LYKEDGGTALTTVLDLLLMSRAEDLKIAASLVRGAISLQMPLVFVRKGSVRYLLVVEPMVLSFVQPAALATRMTAKMRGLASGSTGAVMSFKLL